MNSHRRKKIKRRRLRDAEYRVWLLQNIKKATTLTEDHDFRSWLGITNDEKLWSFLNSCCCDTGFTFEALSAITHFFPEESDWKRFELDELEQMATDRIKQRDEAAREFR